MNNPFLEKFRPYIPASVTNLRELTVGPLIVGTLLGIVFGASSLYLVLKVGLTVSASIPVAVISVTLFRLLSKIGMRDATILEHNIVQTTGSAGESIAFGIGVTMPAILILGFDLEIWRVTMVAVLGGLLGILMMIPLRRALIRDQHGILKYPEGTACAQVLIASASEESKQHSEIAKAGDGAETKGGLIIAAGFAIGFLYNAVMKVFSGWREYPTKEFDEPFKGGSVSLENNPALLGVGYIIGPKIAGIMFAGGVLSYLVLIPMIRYFGELLAVPLAPATGLIKDMPIEGPGSIQSEYILYIGAGAVTAGGIISLIRSLPTIWHGIKGGVADFRSKRAAANGEAEIGELPRTEQDISLKWVVIGILALIVVITFLPALKMNILGAILIIVLGFLFVTVSSRLTGEIGSSSNPISGMTVATLLFTSLAFLLLGWVQPDPYFVTALSVGGIVCIAASNGGTTSQDLKTGFWVGGTPWKQQTAILIGALASALLLGPILIQLNHSSSVYQPVAATAFAPEFQVPQTELVRSGDALMAETPGGYIGTQDTKSYGVWHNTDSTRGPQGRYLVDAQGKPAYLVDPGINGVIKEVQTGVDANGDPVYQSVEKYRAPKATLMSYIIQGILSQQLPWGLVLLGVMISITLELCGISSLASAVGLYLPISASSPIFFGGMVRWGVDKYLKRKFAGREMTEEEFIAETDKSSGVLLASGYIAGGALAGILIALTAVYAGDLIDAMATWAKASNPFYEGDWANVLGMVPFIILAVVLYMAGRDMLFGRRASPPTGE
ncbi:MAG: oligopeptide transporter, OPT family [Pyrinomonadaceae bacterium]|nr:oligopeptide transporter, OPT family [Pyrinomonadaceae bacterium]